MKALVLAIAMCAALAIGGCGGDDDDSTTESAATESTATTTEQSKAPAKKTKPNVSVPNGAPPKQLEVKDFEEGNGAGAKPGDEVTVQYVGVGFKTGEEFDASWDRGEPFTFTLGAKEVIPGWDEGVKGMKAGGRRELVIPPDLAYGEAGAPPAIAPEETLVFVVDLLAVK